MPYVALRPLREEDLVDFYRWQEEDPDWEWFTCRPVIKVEPYAVFRDRFLEGSRRAQQEIRVVEADGQVAGRVVAFDWNARNRSLEIGYYLGAQWRGRGVGRQAVGRWVELLLTTRATVPHKLIATTAQRNLASCGLLQSLGFRLDGRLREHYLVSGEYSDQMIYSLLRREWAPLDAARQSP